jgi:hypothetical protein
VGAAEEPPAAFPLTVTVNNVTPLFSKSVVLDSEIAVVVATLWPAGAIIATSNPGDTDAPW